MATPETIRALLAANALPQRVDFVHRTKSLCENVNDYLYKSAHEPSLAGHRIQEHVHKTVPVLMNNQTIAITTTKKLNGTMFDLDYTSEFLNKLEESVQNSVETREIVSNLASKVSSITSKSTATTTSWPLR